MNNKLWVMGGVILTTLAIAGGAVWWRGRMVEKQKLTEKSSGDQQVAKTPTPAFLTHNDPAGFSIQYPQQLSINLHEEDKENYAQVELNDADHPGRMVFWVKDLPSKVSADGKNLATWISGQARFKGGIIADTTLGGQAAKKVILGNDKTSVILAVFDGVLFEVELVKTDNEYWTQLGEQIITSMRLISIANDEKSVGNGNAATALSAGGGEIIEEEEVVE